MTDAGDPSRLTRYRSVNADLLHGTICRLEERIGRRFPQAGLREVARELVAISDVAVRTSRHIRQPIYLLRAPIWILLVALLGLLMLELWTVGRWGRSRAWRNSCRCWRRRWERSFSWRRWWRSC